MTSLQQPHCKICQIQSPKYRCPRCQIRTCSLPCTKRHKVWYSCSGQRDPAAYKTKDELTTPAGIDQDYNFLRGVERVLETAEERFNTDGDVKGIETGTGSTHEVKRSRNGPRRSKLALEKALSRCGVNIERAPGVFGRAKENGTFFSKQRHCLQWTIEWITDDGTRILGNRSEKDTIEMAYEAAAKAAQHRERGMSKKRKRELPAREGVLENGSQHQGNKAPTPRATSDSARDSSVTEQHGIQPASEVDISKVDPSPTPAIEQYLEPQERSTSSPKASAPKPTSAFEITSDPPLRFYIHIPHRTHPSSKPTVSPLLPTIPLTDALRGRTVLEFPRIYALRNQPGEAPEGVIVEVRLDRGVAKEEDGEVKVNETGAQEGSGLDAKGEGSRVEDVKEKREGEIALEKGEEGLTALQALRLRALRSMGK